MFSWWRLTDGRMGADGCGAECRGARYNVAAMADGIVTVASVRACVRGKLTWEAAISLK